MEPTCLNIVFIVVAYAQAVKRQRHSKLKMEY